MWIMSQSIQKTRPLKRPQVIVNFIYTFYLNISITHSLQYIASAINVVTCSFTLTNFGVTLVKPKDKKEQKKSYLDQMIEKLSQG